MTLWFDVEDLITHFRHMARPTGIQRLTFEIYREVWKAAGEGGEVGFLRHGSTPADYIVVDWPKLEAGILAASSAKRGDKAAQPAAELLAALELTQPAVETTALVEPAESQGAVEPAEALPESGAAGVTAPQPKMPPPAAPVRLNFRGKLHDYLYPRLTPTVREPLGVIYRSQKMSLLAVRDLFKAILMVSAKPGQPPAKIGEVTIRLTTEQVKFAPHDMFIALGASWGQLNAAAGREVQKRYGVRFAVLMHDLIPELYPEWTSREGLAQWRSWLRNVVPYADEIFAVSRHTANDLVKRMTEWNRKVPMPVVLPVGHRRPQHLAERQPGAVRHSPFDRPFILFVSTIEVRKNHALLFRVWRRLLSTMPAAQVPYLVFAGKTAWLTADLLVQIDNTDWLDGHIKLVESPSESELTALYEACAFTVFPSLYEGWGLPVTESLSFGKTVAASNRSAIPEAGADFCCYYDPENVSDAYAVIRGMIENPERVLQLESHIAENFHPPSWADSAAALLEHLQASQPAPTATGPARPDSGDTVMVVA